MKCSHDPTKLLNMPIGMYHCPECGEMVLAGVAHTPDESWFDDPDEDEQIKDFFDNY